MSPSSSSSSTKSFLSALSARAKAHHESVQNAYEAVYGAGTHTRGDLTRNTAAPAYTSNFNSSSSRTSSSTMSVAESCYSISSDSESLIKPAVQIVAAPVAAPSSITGRAWAPSSVWEQVKQRARDHHQSVEAAHAVYWRGSTAGSV